MFSIKDTCQAIVQQDSYDLVTITETWWDDSHDWSAAMDGHKLFRMDTQGMRGGGVALYVMETDVLLGVCYRPPNQDEVVD